MLVAAVAGQSSPRPVRTPQLAHVLLAWARRVLGSSDPARPRASTDGRRWTPALAAFPTVWLKRPRPSSLKAPDAKAAAAPWPLRNIGGRESASWPAGGATATPCMGATRTDKPLTACPCQPWRSWRRLLQGSAVAESILPHTGYPQAAPADSTSISSPWASHPMCPLPSRSLERLPAPHHAEPVHT